MFAVYHTYILTCCATLPKKNKNCARQSVFNPYAQYCDRYHC